MGKLTKLWGVGLSTLLMASVVAGCGANNDNSKNAAGTNQAPAASGSASPTAGGKITLMSDDVNNFGDKFKAYIQKAEQATGITIDAVAMPTNTDDRQAKVVTLVSSGDTSVDVITVGEEMISSLKQTGFLEPLSDVMTKETSAQMPEALIKMMSVNDVPYGVPEFIEILTFWVNQTKLDALGMDTIKTKDDFLKFIKANSKDGQYGYGGAWEKTYVFKDIGVFLNLFGGSFQDWSDPKTQEAVKFMKDMVTDGTTPKAQLADQYTTSVQKFIDGVYGSTFTYSSFMSKFEESGKYGSKGLHIAPMPTFNQSETYVGGWDYVLNASSKNKDAAKKFLTWAASAEGQRAYYDMSTRLPARTDVINSADFDAAGIEDLRHYLNETTLIGSVMPKQSMEFISETGSLFQQYILDELSLEEYCGKMQKVADKYLE